MIGLAAAGGFLYMHKQRGGEMTLDSLTGTARDLFGRARSEAMVLKDRIEKTDVATTLADIAKT